MSLTNRMQDRARPTRTLAEVVSLATRQVTVAAARQRGRLVERAGAGGSLVLLSLGYRDQAPKQHVSAVPRSAGEDTGGQAVGARIYELPVRPSTSGSTSGQLAAVIRLR